MPAIESEPPGGAHETDVTIVGAGPVGLFAVFELGLLGIKARLIDILDRPGGQCAELYPEKPIYDIPGLKMVTGVELTDRLLDQIEPFGAAFHLQEMAVSLAKTDAGWRVETDLGTQITSKAIVIAGGGGSFQPKKPPIPGIADFEDNSVFYAVRRMDDFRGQTIVVAGGGDSALDWALALQPIAGRVTLVHRRPEFRGAPDSAAKAHALIDAGDIDFHEAQSKGLKGEDGVLSAVVLENDSDGEFDVPCDALLPFYGLTMKLGPIAEWGVNLEKNRIPVSTETFETSESGIYAIGDMCWYPGKLKLILSGFHEAALMAHDAFHHVFPDKKLKFQHTTSSSAIQEKLGVDGT